jgi:lycopene beta-cyclase
MQKYDYIFTGSGLSALMTVYEMIVSDKFQDKTILLIDQDPKKSNDRTWCFWDKDATFNTIVSKKWEIAHFANKNYSRNLKLFPYSYKMIRGVDFYTMVFELLSKQENIHFLNEKVIHCEEYENYCTVKTEQSNFTCDKIFSSIFKPDNIKKQSKYPLLQQHFIGWFVKTKEPVFNPEIMTFMDFSIEQKGNTKFMYVLPTSSTEALLEPTLFSHHVLKKEEYEAEIKLYLEKLGVSTYEIVDKEQGNIPMTCYPFWSNNTKNIIYIGSAGGWTKASTGFTFKKTIKKSKELVAFLSEKNKKTVSEIDFRKFHKKDKFWFYDLLLLDVLDKKNHLGSKIFGAIFKKGDATVIFKFLDEETSLSQDIGLMLKCPTFTFLQALFIRTFRLR